MEETKETIRKIVEDSGSKERAAKKLDITPRYLDMLLAGLEPGKHLKKYITKQ